MILDLCGTHSKEQCSNVIYIVCAYTRACGCTCGALQVFPLGDPAVPGSDPTERENKKLAEIKRFVYPLPTLTLIHCAVKETVILDIC